MTDFQDRRGVAVVTGGTGGLGSAICRMLAERGAGVALTYRSDQRAAESLVAELVEGGGVAAADRLDLTDASQSKLYLDSVVERFGAIHTLVHAAGPLIPQVHLSKVEPADFAKHLAAEAEAFFNVVHAALPALRASKGSIVAITTAATHRYPVRDGLSAGPKGAVEATARALAAEEGRFGIRVNCVGPGMLTDGMAADLMASGDLDERALEVTKRNIPLRAFGSAQDIAEAACFLASDRAKFITGQKLDVDGGYGV
ncbi:NAD(P)-dependent dehydrogenase, short-chain alcohol dehydrogenase family [Saccharopolyspora shandongensis]|uniref:NAD(P)-dependent dehydrogenase, short-chain alcohol dehydrogenase family n=1 Tax=Saccharopolyspora shandongensis TaxID=418495 RepID=A0A1H3E4E2_9PSEU|nr:SDR family oxidoreductase [Saccharopolyspora shandongensis]SDX73545.1 NAD(P)-dependent dehydrogenase, short-chain alcohol dehydrogenase family [Saccharopolyspora shandongensis]